MKSILITVMLIITAIMIYNSTVGGDNGTKLAVQNAGSKVNDSIQRINP
jgi:hypothetical protein